MADRPRVLGPIGIRLALGTVGAALAAIGVLATLTLFAARHDVGALALQGEQQTVQAVRRAVTSAYQAGRSWSKTDLAVASTLAARSEARLIVINAKGSRVRVPPPRGVPTPMTPTGPLLSSTVTSGDIRVGTVILHFYRTLPPAQARLRDALIGTVAVGIGLAALLGLGVALVLARWITRPISALSLAVLARAAGDRGVRARTAKGGGELADLANAFDKMVDAVDRQDELRRAVLADVAHELRTPLAILQASTESMSDGVIAPTTANLASVHDEVLRLVRTVEDLATLASAEAASLRMEKQPIDLAAVAASSASLLAPSFEAAGVVLTTDLGPAPTFADPHRFAQVVTNLLSNALKFTGTGGTVAVTTRTSAGWACLEVTDSGVGIPADELDHVFDRFWRGRQVGRIAGTGIGLAVVRALVDASGGQITVTSERLHGSSFSVLLPCARVPSDPGPALPRGETIPLGGGAPEVTGSPEVASASMAVGEE